MATQTEAVKLAMSWIHANGEHDQLCDIFDLDDNGKHKPCSCGLSRVQTCLREALAEQEQGEPVGDGVDEAAFLERFQQNLDRGHKPCQTCEALARTVMLDQSSHDTLQQRTWVGLSEREVELIDGMIQVQLDHANRCDAIANRTMAEKQKGWDMERVALLQKLKEFNT